MQFLARNEEVGEQKNDTDIEDKIGMIDRGGGYFREGEGWNLHLAAA